MKKTFNYYSICWLISLAVFNVIAFVTPNEIAGISKFTGAFWVGYIFITLAFIGQLGCAYNAFKAENLKKLFYNIPLISVSYGSSFHSLLGRYHRLSVSSGVFCYQRYKGDCCGRCSK